jgi:hypothetical protein
LPPAAQRFAQPSTVICRWYRRSLGGLRFDVTGYVTDENRSKIEKIQQNQSRNFVTDEIWIFSALQTARE